MSNSSRRIARAMSHALVAAIVLAAAAPAAADPGDLDPSFDGDGIASTSVRRAGGYPSAVAIQADGRIVLAGPSGDAFVLVRFEPDGTLDPTFGGDGKVVTRLGESGWPVDVAIVGAGLLVATTVGAPESARIVIARYRPHGGLDSTFGTDGTTTLHFNEGAYASEIALQRDGRILLAGTAVRARDSRRSLEERFALARLTSDGRLDPTFGGDGKVTTAVHGQSSRASSVEVSSRGILAVGSMASHRAGRLVAARYTFRGRLDQSFSGDGVFVRSLSERGTSSGGTSVAFDGHGRSVIAASVFDLDSYAENAALIRLRTGGTLDHSFADDGVLVTGFIDAASAVEIQADGRIVVAGGICCGGGSEWTYKVARFAPDGLLDPAFGDHGVAFADTSSPYHAGPLQDVALQPDGRIVAVGVAGYSEGFLAVRLLA